MSNPQNDASSAPETTPKTTWESVELIELNYVLKSEKVIADQAFVKTQLKALSPATRQMLDTVFRAMLVKADPQAGFQFRARVSRADIARQLDKKLLADYDIKKLARLVEAKLLFQAKRPLPIKTVISADGTEFQLGAGACVVYHIPERLLYALVLNGDPQAFAHFSEKLVTAPQPVPTPRQAVPLVQPSMAQQAAAPRQATAPPARKPARPATKAPTSHDLFVERPARRRDTWALRFLLVCTVIALIVGVGLFVGLRLIAG